MRRAPLIVALVSLLFSGPLCAEAPPLHKATFLPQWLPQAQFAGYYLAEERGFYRAHGIDLTILTGGPGRLPSKLLQSGESDFATMWLSSAIEARANGVPIVNVAQVGQQSALMLVARKSSGIRTPEDLYGKKVGVWDGDFLIQTRAFFQRYQLDVRMVPLGSSINLFLRDGVDATVAMWYNEYHTMLSAGLDPDELTTFFFKDHDLDFPGDGIYCREALLASDPGLCHGFAAASLEGWQYAFTHPDEALEVVRRYAEAAHVGTNRAHQRWMLARMKDLIAPPGSQAQIGVLSAKDYARVGYVLLEQKAIAQIPAFDAFYRPAASR
jgi:NitT/TauT family transport system substrate-binding protein